MDRFFQIAAACAVTLGMIGMPAAVRADFKVVLTDTSTAASATLTGANIGVLSVVNTVGNFTVFGTLGTSNSPGSISAMTTVGSFSITNTDTATHTLTITASAQNFTSPQSPPPLTLLDSVSGNLVSGSGNPTATGTFQGSAEAPNGTTTGQLLTFSANGTSQSFSADGSVYGFAPNSNSYSMSITETITLSGGATLLFTGGDVQAVMIAPAPSSVLLFLSSLPVLGSVWASRRRKFAASAQPTAAA